MRLSAFAVPGFAALSALAAAPLPCAADDGPWVTPAPPASGAHS